MFLPVIGVALVLGALAWMVGAQGKAMATEAPKYAENIREKIRSLRTLGDGAVTKRLAAMARQITDDLDSPDGKSDALRNAIKPPQVLVQQGTPSWLAFVPSLLGRLAEALGGLLMALVLLIFMLMNREDLRNRFIRLLGHGRLTTTTKVLDEASQRISRYLLMQLAVNGIFGLMLLTRLVADRASLCALVGLFGFHAAIYPLYRRLGGRVAAGAP